MQKADGWAFRTKFRRAVKHAVEINKQDDGWIRRMNDKGPLYMQSTATRGVVLLPWGHSGRSPASRCCAGAAPPRVVAVGDYLALQLDASWDSLRAEGIGESLRGLTFVATVNESGSWVRQATGDKGVQQIGHGGNRQGSVRAAQETRLRIGLVHGQIRQVIGSQLHQVRSFWRFISLWRSR